MLSIIPFALESDGDVYDSLGLLAAWLAASHHSLNRSLMRILLLALLMIGASVPGWAEDSALAPTDGSASTVPPPNPGKVYLVGRIQNSGTDMEQVVLWRDRSVHSLEECNAARKSSLTSGWTAYHPRFRAFAGMSYKVEYRCVQVQQALTSFHLGTPYDYVYQVHIDGDSLKLTPAKSYIACKQKLENKGVQPSIENFCASATQMLKSGNDSE